MEAVGYVALTPSLERAKRRPVPRDPKTWAKEVDGVRGFLDRLPAWETVWGPGWCEKMGDYYRARLQVLMDNPPPKPKKVARRGKSNRRRPGQ